MLCNTQDTPPFFTPLYTSFSHTSYIDPPYNTGNEGWVYNDNVNAPEIKQWLGKTVGKEADDLSRHDKWLCMMYPRLKLLREFMREDGLIFVSVDDNESRHLALLLDEVFGRVNFQQLFVWKNKYGPGARTTGIGNVHEYVHCYSRQAVQTIDAHLSEEEQIKYKKRDEKYDGRGGFITQPLMTKSKDDRPNLVYPVHHAGEDIWPEKQWIWSRERLETAIASDDVVFRKSKGRWSVRFKQYLRDENGEMRRAKPISLLIGPFNQDGTKELDEIFGDRRFANPKPVALVKYLLGMIINERDEKDALFLDSFAGSGTTMHAVMALNREDGGNRRCIMVEMEEDIAANVTAKRLEKVMQQDGARNDESFRYCTLGDPLFDADGTIREKVRYKDLAHHVFFTETGRPLPKN